MPCSMGCMTNLMVFSQPFCDSRHRRSRIEKQQPSVIDVQQTPIKSCGLIPTPTPVNCCTHALRLTKKPIWVIGYPVTHDIIRCPGQFITQCLDCDYFVSLGHLALIESFRIRMKSNGKVSCLNIRPGQVSVAIFPVVLPARAGSDFSSAE